MKKLGAFVVIFLLLLVLWHSGVLDDERLISALETGVTAALHYLEEGLRFVIGLFK